MSEQLSERLPLAAQPTMTNPAPVAGRKPTRLREWLLAGALVIAACALSAWLAIPDKVAAPANGALVVYEKDLDFGAVWETDSFRWKFTVHNPTGKNIQINRFWTSCNCASVQPDAATVAAGGDAELTLTLDLRTAFANSASSFRGSGQYSGEGHFKADIMPVIADLTFQKGWRIQGQVRKVLAADPPTVDFGESLVQGQPFVPRTVKLRSLTSMKSVIAKTVDSRFLHAEVQKLDGKADEFELVVTPHPSMPAGRHRMRIELAAAGPDGKELPHTWVPVVAQVLDEVQISPPSLSFGNALVGTTVDEYVSLRSLTKSRFAIEGIEPGCDDLGVERVGDPMADIKSFRLKWSVRSAGRQDRRLVFIVRTESGKARRIGLEVFLNGVDRR